MPRTVTVRQDVTPEISVTVIVSDGDAAGDEQVIAEGTQEMGSIRLKKNQLEGLRTLANTLITEARQALTPG